MDANGIPIVKLGDILTKSFKNGIYKAAEFYGRGTPILRINDFDNDGLITNDELSRVELTEKEVNAFRLNADDIVVNRVNSLSHLGKSVLWQGSDEVGVYESNMMRIEPDYSIVLPGYLAKVLQSPEARSHFRRVAKRAVAQCSINQEDVKSLRMPLPALAEQQEITRILSTWDKAINTCSRLIEASLQQKKALAQQLLTGKRRLPGFNVSKELVHTSVGNLPKDWSVVPIGKVATEVSVRNADDEALPVLACSKHVGFVNSLEYFKKKVYSDDLTNYKVVRRGQFGFPSNHIEEGSIGLQDICDAGVVSPIYTVFEIDESRIDSGFLFKVLKTDHYRQRFAAATNASVDRRGSLRWSGFKAIRIPLPSLTEQQAIAAVLDHAAQLEEGYRQQREKLELEKRALMQQLLTGKRRVKLPPEHNTLAKEPAS